VVKIFLSSRDDTNLSQWLEGATELRLQVEMTQNDMHRFVNHCVSSAISNKQLVDGVVDIGLQAKLESYLLARAGRM
jgi:hypothetical protein